MGCGRNGRTALPGVVAALGGGGGLGGGWWGKGELPSAPQGVLKTFPAYGYGARPCEDPIHLAGRHKVVSSAGPQEGGLPKGFHSGQPSSALGDSFRAGGDEIHP